MTHITVPDAVPFLETAVTTAQTDFAFTFTYFDPTDLRVTVDGVELAQSAFEVTGTAGYEGGYPGGTLVLDVAVSNCTVQIWSATPPVRVNDFNEGGGLPARAVNTELDKLTARLRDTRLRMARIPVIAFAANHTLATTEAGQLFTNKGASGTRNLTLPAASMGLEFEFAVVVAHSLAVIAAGDDLISNAGTTGTSIASATIGCYLRLTSTDDGVWTVASVNGTWS